MEVNLRELKKKTADGEHAAVMTDVACEEGCGEPSEGRGWL